ncbi:MAG: response regulator [Anaerolineae bacterium]|nr:response regulator [Anaerolineae bacterium]
MTNLALIVEDEAALRIIYEAVLSNLGFEVLQAADGEEAISLLEHFAPSIVFLDILLPKVDGSQVLDYIQSTPHLHHTATVVVTAHSRFEHIIRLESHDRFLLKPVRPLDIQAAARQVLAPY